MVSGEERLAVNDCSVKWITPWGKAIATVDEDGEVTLATSALPCPAFSKTEWLRFCAAVNEQIINNKKDES